MMEGWVVSPAFGLVLCEESISKRHRSVGPANLIPDLHRELRAGGRVYMLSPCSDT